MELRKILSTYAKESFRDDRKQNTKLANKIIQKYYVNHRPENTKKDEIQIPNIFNKQPI